MPNSPLKGSNTRCTRTSLSICSSCPRRLTSSPCSTGGKRSSPPATWLARHWLSAPEVFGQPAAGVVESFWIAAQERCLVGIGSGKRKGIRVGHRVATRHVCGLEDPSLRWRLQRDPTAKPPDDLNSPILASQAFNGVGDFAEVSISAALECRDAGPDLRTNCIEPASPSDATITIGPGVVPWDLAGHFVSWG